MKKFFKSFLTALIIVPSIFVLSGCGKKDDPTVLLTNVGFDQVDTAFETGEIFSLNGAQLVFTYSDGDTTIITLNDSMIKSMPDMTTPG